MDVRVYSVDICLALLDICEHILIYVRSSLLTCLIEVCTCTHEQAAIAVPTLMVAGADDGCIPWSNVQFRRFMPLSYRKPSAE